MRLGSRNESMAENRTEVLTGGAVLAVAIGFMLWAAQGASFGARSGGYELRASFRSVEGITVGSDVRLAGVKIGTITSLSLNPQTFFADATLRVNDSVLLPTDSAILVSSEGLLGGAYIEIVPGGSFENLARGEEIEDTQGAINLLSLLMKFVDGSGAANSGPTE
jgi:phospholipid/cholesterol/gamma-HCH transport system substrate-binding protein